MQLQRLQLLLLLFHKLRAAVSILAHLRLQLLQSVCSSSAELVCFRISYDAWCMTHMLQ
jgi:hypothetical protein